MKKVVLFSFFNSNNVGDRVIADIISNRLSEKYYVIPCSIEGNFDIHNRYVPERLSIANRVVNKICNLFGKRYLTPRYKHFLKQYKRILNDCSHVFIGGGNILMDYSSSTRSYQKIKDIVLIAKDNGVDCSAISIGIGPFFEKSQAMSAVSVLEECRSLTFRDENSLRLFLENGGTKEKAKVSFDPAFLFSYYNKPIEKKDNAKGIIGLNVIYPFWEGEKTAKIILDKYVCLVKYISKHCDKKIMLFCTEQNDERAIEYIFDSTKEQNVIKFAVNDIKDLINLYQMTDFVIGARMHSLIIAYSCRICVIGLSWTDKVLGFFKKIDKTDCCFDIHKMDECSDKICDIVNGQNKDWNFEKVLLRAKESLDSDFRQW